MRRVAPRWVPRYLAPWAAAITDLQASIWVELESLASGVGRLLGGDTLGEGDDAGELDGYDGLSRRGHPDTLRLSEWAMADVAPDEFLRRAAERELLYLRPRRRVPRSRRAILVVVDTGPDQLGVARVAQMAVLLALADRAQARGAAFAWLHIGTPAPASAATVEGLSPDSVRLFLAARVATPWTSARIATFRDRFDTPERDLWWLGGPHFTAAAGGRRVTVRPETRDGATHVAITVHGQRSVHTTTLALPAPDACVRLLRRPFQAPKPVPPHAEPRSRSYPMVFGEGGRLFVQTGPGEVRAEHVPAHADDPQGKPKFLRVHGTLLAAGKIHGELAAFYRSSHGHLKLRRGGRDLMVTLDAARPLQPQAGRLGWFVSLPVDQSLADRFVLFTEDDGAWYGQRQGLRVHLSPIANALDSGLLTERQQIALSARALGIEQIRPDGRKLGADDWAYRLPKPFLRVVCHREGRTFSTHARFRHTGDVVSEEVHLPINALPLGGGRVHATGGVLIWLSADRRAVHMIRDTDDRVVLRSAEPIVDWRLSADGYLVAVRDAAGHLAVLSVGSKKPVRVDAGLRPASSPREGRR